MMFSGPCSAPRTVVRLHGRDPDRDRTISRDGRDVLEGRVLGPGRCLPLGHRRVVVGNALEEGRNRAIGKRLRHQRLDRDISQVQFTADRPGQDQRLARNIEAAQVVTRIRLGVTGRLGRDDRLRHRLAVGDVGEDRAEGAREATDDLDHPVTGRQQGFERRDDRQSGAARRLVPDTTSRCRIPEPTRIAHRPREWGLVRVDDRPISLQRRFGNR